MSQLYDILASLKDYVEYQRLLGARDFPFGQEDPLQEIDRALALQAVRGELGDCIRCRLHQGRRHLVFGEGNPYADLVFVGEGPGEDEDRQGRPFVGRAGQLLDRIIQAIGMQREDVYIANIVKCRPPDNRTPKPDEIHTCEPFLLKQLGVIKPQIICALGNAAAQTLLKTDRRISQLRGRFHDLGGIKVMPTYHPAYLLRNPDDKRLVWEDMKMVRDELSLQKRRDARLNPDALPRKG